MITLPTSPAPRSARPVLIDFGLVQRPATGAPATYIDRPGLRMAVEFGLPPMAAETARPFISRLMRAKSDGIRVPFPLLGVSQGSPGSPIVNGAAAGTNLPVIGATSGFQVKEGWWLNVIDDDGVYYLHNVAADVTLTGGAGTISVWPPLRAALGGGETVVLNAPKIEGLVTSPIEWPLAVEKIVQLNFTVEESA